MCYNLFEVKEHSHAYRLCRKGMMLIFLMCTVCCDKSLQLQAKAAIRKEHSTVLDVVPLIGIPDYASAFDALEFDPCNFQGLMDAQEFRICMGGTAKCHELQLHYRADCTVEGWLPRPVLPTRRLASKWKDYFKPSDPSQGVPVS